MKKSILSVIILIIILTILGLSAIETKNEISAKDIDEGKHVVERYFEGFKNKDIIEINKTLGNYKKGMYNKDNIDNIDNKITELISVSYPGEYNKSNLPPTSYKSNYGKNPYKSMSISAKYKEDEIQKQCDYILIKETKDSPWEIHDWGY